LASLDKKNVRYNILYILVYIVGIILIFQLFNLQIVHGEEYLQRANSRLTRETKIRAARGNILDCNGNVLAGNEIKYSLKIYKSKIDEQNLNTTILNAIFVLEKNGDKYNDDFPININPVSFKYENQERINKWLEENDLADGTTAEQALEYFIDEYSLKQYSLEEARKIIAVRYGIDVNGYSSMRGYEISPEVCEKSVAQIEEMNHSFPGINIEYRPIRKYYYSSLASHVLGYVGKIGNEEYTQNEGYELDDYIGKTGIEYVCEKFLKGKDGLKQTDMSIDGTTTGEYITEEAISGSNVMLTIDAKVQQVAERALKENIEKINNGDYGEKREVYAGSVVVLNVKTGEVISMVSYPDFEPQLFVDGISTEKWNEYTVKGRSALINRTMQSAYAPGSIFKMVPAIAGLETGKITKDEQIECAGIYPGGYKPKCWYYTTYGRGHGYLTVSQAIQKSCNCYFYEVGTRIGIDNIEKYATYFGLGQKTNIELPGEISGTLAGKKLYEKLDEAWYYGNTLSAVIGQAENNFTPIQMARYIAMLTNGGKKLDLTIIKDIINNQGESIKTEEVKDYINKRLGIEKTSEENLNIQKENLKTVLEGMQSVTEEGGTAYSVFKDFPIQVGGKTGSAEAGNDKTNAWFVGFAPYENPEIAVVVLVENGAHGYYSAEVTKEIMEAYFGLNEEIVEDKTAKPYTNL
jgi:penicillin-binding protein 2